MIVRAPTSLASLRLVHDLGPGESQVLAVALETPGSVAVLDDRLARPEAEALQLPLTGTLGLPSTSRPSNSACGICARRVRKDPLWQYLPRGRQVRAPGLGRVPLGHLIQRHHGGAAAMPKPSSNCDDIVLAHLVDERGAQVRLAEVHQAASRSSQL